MICNKKTPYLWLINVYCKFTILNSITYTVANSRRQFEFSVQSTCRHILWGLAGDSVFISATLGWYVLLKSKGGCSVKKQQNNLTRQGH